jgi:hypothetical protein
MSKESGSHHRTQWPVTCSTGEVTRNYREYLKTRHWEKVKHLYYMKNPRNCGMCESTAILNLHHKTYERIGNEKMGDLICLCSQCHHRFHESRDDRANHFLGMEISGGPVEQVKVIAPVEPDRSLEFHHQRDKARSKEKSNLPKKRSDWIATRDGIVISNSDTTP